ncbi:hypothetical protein IE53DRAFT_371810 [Violaceomyces palustris]|uniref:Uncharacterized protein n=1 Tax=Violaceomyces palustris TaxID=1673888 RepID=A0ACD0NMH4_9BASI|nr:hypothetical protein IE53DRAFT_371810 [Violaceomyces palustris]
MSSVKGGIGSKRSVSPSADFQVKKAKVERIQDEDVSLQEKVYLGDQASHSSLDDAEKSSHDGPSLFQDDPKSSPVMEKDSCQNKGHSPGGEKPNIENLTVGSFSATFEASAKDYSPTGQNRFETDGRYLCGRDDESRRYVKETPEEVEEGSKDGPKEKEKEVPKGGLTEEPSEEPRLETKEKSKDELGKPTPVEETYILNEGSQGSLAGPSPDAKSALKKVLEKSADQNHGVKDFSLVKEERKEGGVCGVGIQEECRNHQERPEGAGAYGMSMDDGNSSLDAKDGLVAAEMKGKRHQADVRRPEEGSKGQATENSPIASPVGNESAELESQKVAKERKKGPGEDATQGGKDAPRVQLDDIQKRLSELKEKFSQKPAASSQLPNLRPSLPEPPTKAARWALPKLPAKPGVAGHGRPDPKGIQIQSGPSGGGIPTKPTTSAGDLPPRPISKKPSLERHQVKGTHAPGKTWGPPLPSPQLNPVSVKPEEENDTEKAEKMRQWERCLRVRKAAADARGEKPPEVRQFGKAATPQWASYQSSDQKASQARNNDNGRRIHENWSESVAPNLFNSQQPPPLTPSYQEQPAPAHAQPTSGTHILYSVPPALGPPSMPIAWREPHLLAEASQTPNYGRQLPLQPPPSYEAQPSFPRPLDQSSVNQVRPLAPSHYPQSQPHSISIRPMSAQRTQASQGPPPGASMRTSMDAWGHQLSPQTFQTPSPGGFNARNDPTSSSYGSSPVPGYNHVEDTYDPRAAPKLNLASAPPQPSQAMGLNEIQRVEGSYSSGPHLEQHFQPPQPVQSRTYDYSQYTKPTITKRASGGASAHRRPPPPSPHTAAARPPPPPPLAPSYGSERSFDAAPGPPRNQKGPMSLDPEQSGRTMTDRWDYGSNQVNQGWNVFPPAEASVPTPPAVPVRPSYTQSPSVVSHPTSMPTSSLGGQYYGLAAPPRPPTASSDPGYDRYVTAHHTGSVASHWGHQHPRPQDPSFAYPRPPPPGHGGATQAPPRHGQRWT